MAKREFTFRGKTLPELLEMELKQFSEIAGSRIRRSISRGLNEKVLKRVQRANEEKRAGKEPRIIRTQSRDFPVLPSMIGLKFGVHNGKEFQIVQITEKMLGHYLGELALTRKRLMHGKAGIGATKSSTAITARG
ncbi:MAG: 30S ribosomal protein S19 [Candidatus Diapherotrites archaeon]|uniref:Small ribosomal subunit protein uS19 n=1 Tax=Candidatus Iainarchaeum sp. TaxID=3101447 RepID=A0A7J4IS44_9ARCH|nr:MAG: small subunit ribosomal protein S19 [archaeon GW2011_AR10]AJS11759.1 ribosomal protein S19 [uncultured archaeon]MBS3059349.1 30S ribosomal protein S19 [Candidatus Diapherotrites archaeon]HIH08328.1 30S ribosomal protein S19 [Candidatus Diapherotrites archaeon]